MTRTPWGRCYYRDSVYHRLFSAYQSSKSESGSAFEVHGLISGGTIGWTSLPAHAAVPALWPFRMRGNSRFAPKPLLPGKHSFACLSTRDTMPLCESPTFYWPCTEGGRRKSRAHPALILTLLGREGEGKHSILLIGSNV
jgi:hypothetical protein